MKFTRAINRLPIYHTYTPSTARICRLPTCPYRPRSYRLRQYSTGAPPPPQLQLLTTLRTDLKTALRAKDQTRLSVLRSVLSDITNAFKTSAANQPTTDLSILRILRKRAADASKNASTFTDEGRRDLAEREEAEEKICEEYVGQVDVMSDEEVRTRVAEVVEQLSEEAEARGKGGEKARKGVVVKRLLGPGGVLEGKNVERGKVVEMVDLALGAE